jgi:molecular chaperone GrpE
MSKQRLRDKLVDFQRDIISLSQALQAKEQAYRDGEDHLLLELILVLDAFDNIFNSLADKAETFDKSMRRALNSFTRVQSKVRRILEARGVEQIACPDGKAVVGLCKVVETQAVAGRQEGEIISVVRHGYRHGDRVLRPAEVITVANHTSSR